MARKISVIKLNRPRTLHRDGKALHLAAGTIVRTPDPEEAAQLVGGGNEWGKDDDEENLIPMNPPAAKKKKAGRPPKAKASEPAKEPETANVH